MFLASLGMLWGSVGLAAAVDDVKYFLAYRRWPSPDLHGFGVWLCGGLAMYVLVRTISWMASLAQPGSKHEPAQQRRRRS
jgi:hypothetical protein